MRLATVHHPRGGTAAVVERDGNWHPLPATDLSEVFASGRLSELAELAEVAELSAPIADPRFAAPVKAAKIICCGLNYADHIAETGRPTPEYPTLFAKYPDSILGPSDDIVLPSQVNVDWEAELAVVIGATVRRVSPDSARRAIGGYTVANDISVRDWQYRTPQWFQGKSWERSTPVGPVVVTPDELDLQSGLEVVCRVDGDELQRGNTSQLVFDPATLVAYISSFTTLRPGDLVLTGTPAGIGSAMTPPRFLRSGQVVEAEIEGIGVVRNTFRAESFQEVP